jgi:hypothetical protein
VNRTASPHLLVWLGAGFAVWASALVALYAVQAIGCAFVWPAALLRVGLGAALLVHIAVLAAIWHQLANRPILATNGGTRDFLVTISLWATVAAIATTVFTLGPPLLLTTCV